MQRLLCVIGSFRLTRNGLLRQTANRTANIPPATIRENLPLLLRSDGPNSNLRESRQYLSVSRIRPRQDRPMRWRRKPPSSFCRRGKVSGAYLKVCICPKLPSRKSKCHQLVGAGVYDTAVRSATAQANDLQQLLLTYWEMRCFAPSPSFGRAPIERATPESTGTCQRPVPPVLVASTLFRPIRSTSVAP